MSLLNKVKRAGLDSRSRMYTGIRGSWPSFRVKNFKYSYFNSMVSIIVKKKRPGVCPLIVKESLDIRLNILEIIRGLKSNKDID